jgi:penicillin amidase
MSRKLVKVLAWVIGVILVLAVLLSLSGIFLVRRSFPQTDGQVKLAGLDGPVDVYRDSYGIPHIYATTTHDLFFAEGYVHAQDRFWQMDFWRHIGSGRLAEMFGEDQVETDQFLRTLGWARVVQEELETIDADSLAILESYSAGVNAYLEDHGGSALSLEYSILKLTNSAYQPEPWEPLHSLTWAKAMAWELGGNLDAEILRAILLKTLTPEQVEQIVPPYPEDKPVIVPGYRMPVANLIPESSFRTPSQQVSVQVLPPGSTPVQSSLLAELSNLESRLAQLEILLGPLGAGIGSNNWVISGERTASGLPLLANDPHLGAQMPSIWYEIGLHCIEKNADCPYEVTGVSFAGAPGVIIGHNDRIAWGFTNVGPDVQDLYIEKINPANPNQYEVNGEWVDMELVEETIQVAGSEPQPLTVRYTRHGPIISETYLPEDFSQKAGIELPESYALALRWTALEPIYTFRAMWKFDRAQNWDEFRLAARDMAAPAQNLVYADVEGNIGYQTPGNIPIRANGDGSLSVPGWTDEYEWQAYIPFDELPYAFNPAEGYIVTANNAVVRDYPYLISQVWAYGYRAQRIVDLIEGAPSPIDTAYIQQMQGDNFDQNAAELTPFLMQIDLGDEKLEQARQILEGWDYQNHMDSAPSALFKSFWKNLLALTFQDDLPEEAWPDGGDRWYVSVKDLVRQSSDPWWDNQTTAEIETRDVIFQQAFADAVTELSATQGGDPEQWNWGDLHTLTLENQTLGQSGIAPVEALFNRGPYRTSGGADMVNATGWDAAESYAVESLPSMRMIVDLSDLTNSFNMHTTGQSGHAYHPHYVDMADLWRLIKYHPMLWDRAQIEAGADGHLKLLP